MAPTATPTPIPALAPLDRPVEVVVYALDGVDDCEDVDVGVTEDVEDEEVVVDAKLEAVYLILTPYALTTYGAFELVVTIPVPGSLMVYVYRAVVDTT